MDMYKTFEDSLKEIPALREKVKGNKELEKAVDDAEYHLKDLIKYWPYISTIKWLNKEVKSDERIS